MKSIQGMDSKMPKGGLFDEDEVPIEKGADKTKRQHEVLRRLFDEDSRQIDSQADFLPPNPDENTGHFQEKTKTSLRMQYEAQSKVIEKQIGGLEGVRRQLQLSQRKMCQLLLVDPSAWTRWVKSGQVPPHVLRALQWYLIIQEKIPGLTPQYFLGKDPEVLHRMALQKIAEEKILREDLVKNVFTQTVQLEDDLKALQIANEDLQKKLAVEILEFKAFKKRILISLLILTLGGVCLFYFFSRS